MDEQTIRAVTAAHRELVAEAIKLADEHWGAIAQDRYPFKPDISDEDGATLTINGDVATLHFTAEGFDYPYASSFDFDARCLWSAEALEGAQRRYAEREAADHAEYVARQEASERAQFETLRRKFESTDLRSDIRKAIEITALIAEEDGATEPRPTENP